MLGKGPVTPRVPEMGTLSQNRRGAPDPPRGPGPHILSGPLNREGTDTPLGGVRSRHVFAGAGTHARPRGFLEKTRHLPHSMREALSALCHSRARGDFCQTVLLIAHYRGAQCSRWRHPRHARQSATPVRHDSSGRSIMTPTRQTQQSTPQPTLPQRASCRWDK